MLLQELENLLTKLLTTKYTFCYGADVSKEDNVITLTEYGGKPLGDFTTAASRYVQIKLRNVKSQGGYKDIWHIYNSLVTSNEYRNEAFWMQYFLANTPVVIGLDKNGRQRYTLNIQIFTDIKEE